MIKVAFLVRSLNLGGAERQLVTLAKALDQDRFDVWVITFYGGGRLESELIDCRIKLICLGKRGRWDLIRFLWNVIGQLKTIRPDILNSYLVEPNLVAVFLKPFLRPTKIVWSLLASDMNLGHYDWFVRVNFRLQALVSGFANLIIHNSEAGRRHHIAHGFPPHNSIVIRNGIDVLKFNANRESGKAVRQGWRVSDSSVLIGLVGRLDPVKDHETFLKAAAIICASEPGVMFVCVGGGPEERARELRRLAEELQITERVIWAGERDDMPATYNALDVVCSSSITEGAPFAIAEAMACGVPCVVTNVGDSASLVGDTGFVVPPADPEALAKGLLTCIKRLQSGEGADPRAHVEKHFGAKMLKDQTEEAFTNLVTRRD
ncbi:MAG TPA: glycosyltransferase [Pyrinomonadaceae bacterium]|nr:glycosyltransferase [Pyrinomonadaceae bacterium]